MKKEENQKTVELIFNRYENTDAILIFDGNEFSVPAAIVPKKLAEKDVIVGSFATLEAFEKAKNMKAKEILNEILG